MKKIIQPIRIRSGNFFNLLLILLFAIIGNPVPGNALGPISSVYSPARQHSEVFLKGNDGVLHHYYVENGTWQHDGTTFSGFPVADHISAIYAPQRSHTEVFYQGTDGLLHYWYKEGGSWQHDGTTFRGFPVGGKISAIYAPQRSHAEVFYKGTDGLLHYWYVEGGAWRHDGTTFQGVPVGGDISAIYAPQRKHAEVFYKGTDEMLHGKLQYWYVEGGAWRHGCFGDDVSYNKFSTSFFVGGDISATFATQRNHAEVFYAGEDNIIYYWYVESGAWKRGYFHEMAVDGDISATFASQRSHSEFFYIGRDGLLHYYYVDGGAWGHDGTTFKGSPPSNVLPAPNVLPADGTLFPGQGLISPNGLFQAVMEPHGNFKVYYNGYTVWETHTAGNDGAALVMHQEGLLVLYKNGKPIWDSGNSKGGKGCILVLENSGRLIVCQQNTPEGTLVFWATPEAPENLCEIIARWERTDGCSVPFPEKVTPYARLFESACNDHDICYSTTDNGKNYCDKELLNDMRCACEDEYSGPLRSLCYIAAQAYYEAVQNGKEAQDGFESGQIWKKKNCN